MLDIRHVRASPEEVKANLARRKDPSLLKRLEVLLAADKAWRTGQSKVEALRKQRNTLSRQINAHKTQGKDTTNLLKEAKAVPKKIDALEKETLKANKEVHNELMRLPNLLHPDVPEGKDETENQEVHAWGKPTKAPFKLKHHGQLAVEKGWADFERAVKISGAGFYFLTGDLATLDLAIQRFALDIMAERGFTPVYPPFMMRRKPYEGVVDLGDFETVMYKTEGEDEYLIATSEHPLAAMHAGEILSEKDLPIKYVGVSACFRREIGKHSVDERGLFRVHQFNKVEQFIFCTPEQSWDMHEELLKNSEDLMKKIGLPYRVVNVCTGDMGTLAAKKYDVEGWSPREQKYIELMSCSNCTDYQARRLKIRIRRGQDKVTAHTLNNTAIATARTLRVLLETLQHEDGTVDIPKALQPYMGGKKQLEARTTPGSG